MGRARPSGMRSILHLLFVLLTFAGSSAFASGSVPLPASSVSCAGHVAPTAEVACAAAAQATADAYHAADDRDVGTFSINGCGSNYCSVTMTVSHTYRGPDVNTTNYFFIPYAGSCPPNSTPNGGGSCDCTDPNTPQGGQCLPPNACSGEAGKSINTNFTVGWVKNPNYSPVDAPENMVGNYLGPKVNTYECVAGCRRYIDDTKAQGYASMEGGPNGLFRLSMDFTTVGQGTACTSPNPSADPNTPSPPCPGTMGQVNGKNVCLPKAGPNSTPLPTPANPASAPPAGAPVTSGNPSAGDQPSSGQGSGSGGTGRTPTTGSGGNAGGGSSATGGGSTGGSGSTGGGAAGGGATTSGGSGTSTDPYRPKDPCGLPGTPACKLDETGTPSGDGAYNGASDKLGVESGKHNAAVTGAGTSVTGLSWTWNYTLPQGGCTPFHWGKGAAYEVNPCTSPWIANFRTLMAYLFFGLAAFYCWKSTVSPPAGGK